MNKNTVIAVALFVALYVFITSPLYYKLRGKPYPKGKQNQSVTTEVLDSLSSEEPDSGVVMAEETQPAELVPHEPDSQSAVEPAAAVVPESSADSGEAGQPTDTVWVVSEHLAVGLDERGGDIVSLRMRDYGYRTPGGTPQADSVIELIPPEAAVGGATVKVDKDDYTETPFYADTDADTLFVDKDDSVTVVMTGQTVDGRGIEKVYVVRGDSYLMDVSVRSTAIAGRNVTLSWECGIDESEWMSGDKSVRYDRRKTHLFVGGDVEKVTWKKPRNEERTGSYEWMGISSKYFLVAMIPDGVRECDVAVAAFPDTVTRAEPKAGNQNFRLAVTRMTDGTEERYQLYAGPMQLGRLREVGNGLQKVLFGGWRWFLMADKWFPAICELTLVLLILLGGFLKDYGVAIIVLTVIVKAVTYPLSVSSMKSMSRMKDIQPKINAVRQRYKADPRKMNEELMALYREEGINPLNPGCLPMFLQMPVLISLFVVLRKAIELRGAHSVLLPWVHDLSQAEVIAKLPFDIPGYGNTFAIMPIIMAGLTFLQNKMTMKDPNQKAMVYMMPIMMLVLFNNFPSGLVFYYTLSSALGIAQQRLIERQRAKLEGSRQPAAVVQQPKTLPPSARKKKKRSR